MGLLVTSAAAFCVLAVAIRIGCVESVKVSDHSHAGLSWQRPLAGGLLPAPAALAQHLSSPPRRRISEDDPAEHDVCSFYKSGYGTETDEIKWGSGNICTVPEGSRWARRASARCRDCLSDTNLCDRPPRLLIHQYLNHLDPTDWRGNLLSLKAYILTQDLSKTELILWADDPASIVNNDTRPFFDGFASNIRVRKFEYAAEVKGTVMEGDAYFGSEAAIKASVPKGKPASYSDLVRYILLHNHGGLWIDGDTVLMQDVYGVTVKVGYQFAMRWMNAHVFYVKRRSLLAQRILETTMTMPLNHPNLEEDIVEKVCKPNGYFTVVDFENLSDIWAFCVLRLVIRGDNTGAADNILYDQPLGWWDAHWPGSHNAQGCYTNDAPVNDTYFEDYVGASMALHTRYPGHNGHQPVPGSPLGRIIEIIEAVFETCSSTACVPEQAQPLLAFWNADSDPKAFPPASAFARAPTSDDSLPKQAAVSQAPKEASGRGTEEGGVGVRAVSSGLEDNIGLARGNGDQRGWGSVVDPSLREDDLPLSRNATQSVAETGAGLVSGPASAGNSPEGLGTDDVSGAAPQRHRVQHHKNKWTWGRHRTR